MGKGPYHTKLGDLSSVFGTYVKVKVEGENYSTNLYMCATVCTPPVMHTWTNTLK